MIYWITLLFTFHLFPGCQKAPERTELSDDYVLVEFAAKLEEEELKIYPEPLDKHQKQPTE